MIFLAVVNAFALGLLILSCIIRVAALKGNERPIESIALILFSFSALGQMLHYLEAPAQLDLMDVIFNCSISVLGGILAQKGWRHYFFERRREQIAIAHERRGP